MLIFEWRHINDRTTSRKGFLRYVFFYWRRMKSIFQWAYATLFFKSFDHVDVTAQPDPQWQLAEIDVEGGRNDAVHRNDVVQLILRIIQNILDRDLRSGDRVTDTISTNDVHSEDEIFRQHILEEGEEIRYAIYGRRIEDQIGTLHSRRVSGLFAPNVPAYVNVKTTYVFFIRDFRNLIISTNITNITISFFPLKK